MGHRQVIKGSFRRAAFSACSCGRWLCYCKNRLKIPHCTYLLHLHASNARHVNEPLDATANVKVSDVMHAENAFELKTLNKTFKAESLIVLD